MSIEMYTALIAPKRQKAQLDNYLVILKVLLQKVIVIDKNDSGDDEDNQFQLSKVGGPKRKGN